MTTAAHTPGPWNLRLMQDRSIKHFCPVDADGQSLLTVVDQGGTLFAGIYVDADARLIAAAPELLAALRACVLAMKADLPPAATHAEIDQACTAIFAATGEVV